MSDPAGVTEIGDFNGYGFKRLVGGGFDIWCTSRAAGLVKCNAGDFFGKKVARANLVWIAHGQQKGRGRKKNARCFFSLLLHVIFAGTGPEPESLGHG